MGESLVRFADSALARVHPERLVIGHPDLDRFVALQGGRRDDVLGRMAGGAQDHICVTLQLLNDLARLQVPDVDQMIFRIGHLPPVTEKLANMQSSSPTV